MSTSIDAEFTNNLERAYASDENLAETLMGRTVAEAARLLTGSATFVGHQPALGVDNTLFDMQTKTRVFGLAIATITDIPREMTISGGVVVTNDGAEAPGVDDSSVRVGILPEGDTATIAIPAADDLWHLLECRVVNEDVSEMRDILTNVVTRTYAPQNVVKRKLKRLEFQITTGTATDIPIATAGWVPLYGFIIPTAGLAIPDMAMVVDLRQSMPTGPRTKNHGDGVFKGVSRVTSRRMSTVSTLAAPGSSQFVQFDLTAEVDGITLHAHTVNAGADISRFIPGGGAPAASTWYYLYLAPWPNGLDGGMVGNACWGGRQEPIISNCLVILSAVTPSKDGRNSAQLTPNPAPFAGLGTAIGNALCVGVLRQGAAATGWEPEYTSVDGHVKIAADSLSTTFTPAAVGAQAISVTTAAILPVNMVRHVDLQFGMSVLSTTQAAGGVGGRFLVTPCRVDAVAVNNALAFGSVVVDPLMQEDHKFITAPLADDDLVSTLGTVIYKVETRDPTGLVYGVNGLINQVANDGAARLQCRVTGFKL